MNNLRIIGTIWLVCVFVASFATAQEQAPIADDQKKQDIKAIYIPLADHYAGIVAYEKYRGQMKYADFQIERIKSWPLLRAYFMSGEVDMAFIICPMAMDMFREEPSFRWVSLMHRDGNALAINDLFKSYMELPVRRNDRKPNAEVAEAFINARGDRGRPIECGVPDLQATHTVVLYKYLKEHGKTLGLGRGPNKDVVATEVSPSKSPAFIKKNNSRDIPASFLQSLPWADVVETQNFGHVAWYSKDVMPWPNGHVECIVIATDECIKKKSDALKEVIYYIHKAGLDIEAARTKGGSALNQFADMIHKHIPEHNKEAIIQSLRPDLLVINYMNLNVDLGGLKQIMDCAVEGGILKAPIDINDFADSRFSTRITAVSGLPGIPTDCIQEVLSEEISLISKFAANPIVVASVKEQNAKGVTLERVKVIDKEWTAGGQETFAESLQNNRIGLLLRERLLEKKDLYTEAFLCDAQGAVVGEYPKTSDYWQGDEEKFTKSINGKVYVGPLLLDESTQSFSIQISVPVMDHDSAIGVLVVGIRNLESLAITNDEKWTMSEN